MKMQFFEKLWKMLTQKGKHRNIKLVTTENRRNYLVPELNYRTAKFFVKNLLAIEMRKTQILTNRPIYHVLSILNLNKAL